MKWSLQMLEKIVVSPTPFCSTFDFKDDIKDLEDVYDIDTAYVEGQIIKVGIQTYQFDFSIVVNITMACSLTLEPVIYQMNEKYSEIYSTEKNEDWFLIEKNTIDLREMVWSNIVMSLPIRIVRDDAYDILSARGIEIEVEPNEDL